MNNPLKLGGFGKDIYFTEASGGQWDTDFGHILSWITRYLLIGQTSIGARTILLWNLALDTGHGPQVGFRGSTEDDGSKLRGVVTINGTSRSSYVRNPEYFALGMFSTFVHPGAKRINSTTYDVCMN